LQLSDFAFWSPLTPFLQWWTLLFDFFNADFIPVFSVGLSIDPPNGFQFPSSVINRLYATLTRFFTIMAITTLMADTTIVFPIIQRVYPPIFIQISSSVFSQSSTLVHLFDLDSFGHFDRSGICSHPSHAWLEP
jgi:hypothetical protein